MYAWPTKQPQHLITIILLSCSLTSRLVISRRQLLEELLDHALNPGALARISRTFSVRLRASAGLALATTGMPMTRAWSALVDTRALLSLTVVEPARSWP